MLSGIPSGIRAAASRTVVLLLLARPAGAQQASPLTVTAPPSLGLATDVTGEVTPREDRGAPWVTRKRWGLAIPGMIAGNAIPMIYNEFVQPWKEISRTSPHTWSLYGNPLTQWEWDDNHFLNNQILHPIQGNWYFNAGRSNGFNYYWSTAFALVGSYLWECCSERRKGSYNDWANTTLGGAALGEMLHRATSLIIDQDARGLDRVGLELLVLPLNPERFLARGIYGQWRDRGNPPGRLPDEWGLAVASGLRWTGGRPHPLLDLELRYGSMWGTTHDNPFDRFTLNVQFNSRDNTVGLVEVEGHLAYRVLAGTPLEEDPGGWILKLLWIQNYDYLDSSPDPDVVPIEREYGYRYGGQSVGAGLASAFPVWAARVEAQAQVDFIPIGAVNSIHSHVRGANPERSREYDFGIGFGYRARTRVSLPKWVRGRGSFAAMHLYTLNGSNVCDALGCSESKHRVQTWAGAVSLELDRILGAITGVHVGWAEDFWIGGDYFWFKKVSRYTEPDRMPEDFVSDQWRVMLYWDWTP